MVAEASAEASTQGLLKAMIPSLECYYQLPANKKTLKQNFSLPPIKSTKPFSRLLAPYLYLQLTKRNLFTIVLESPRL
jgi:hypothetical protein